MKNDIELKVKIIGAWKLVALGYLKGVGLALGVASVVGAAYLLLW